MSQIVTSYLVAPEILDDLEQMSKKKQFNEFWKTLNTRATEVAPAFEYSGYLVAVLLEYLRENQVALPEQAKNSTGKVLDLSAVSLAIWADKTTAKGLADQVNQLEVTRGDLEQYFQEFSGETDEVGEPMEAALTFLKRALQALQEGRDDLCLLMFIG